MTTATCPKCDGRKKLSWASHVANGDCFMCNASGSVEVGTPKQIAEISPENRKRAEWILNATPEQFEKLTYKQIHAAMDFSCGGWGISEAYPTLRDAFESKGRDAFNRRQEEKLAAYYQG